MSEESTPPHGFNEDPSDRPAPEDLALPRYPAGSDDIPSHPDIPGPLSVGGTLTTALRLYGRDLLPVWAGVAVVYIPIVIIIFLLRDASIPTGAVLYHAKLYVQPGTSDGAYIGFGLLGDVLDFVASLLVTGVVYRILLGRYLQHPANLAASFSFARQRVAKLLGVTVFTAVVVIIGFIFIIIPGIYLLVVLSAAIPVAMAENLSVSQSLGRSRELVRDLWWHCFGVVLAQAVVVGVLDFVISEAITRAIVHSSHSISAFLLVSSVVQIIFALLSTPFTAGVSIVLYVDLLLRKRDPQLPALLD